MLRSKSKSGLLTIYSVHRITGNPWWKIKWLAPFRLESFRKHGLRFDTMRFFYSLVRLADLGIICSGSFSHHVKFYSFIFTRMVCVNGKHVPLPYSCWFRKTRDLRCLKRVRILGFSATSIKNTTIHLKDFAKAFRHAGEIRQRLG